MDRLVNSNDGTNQLFSDSDRTRVSVVRVGRVGFANIAIEGELHIFGYYEC